MSRAVVCAPLWVEWLALHGRVPGLCHTGMGPERARRAASALATRARAASAPVAGGPAVLVAGLGGALQPGIAPGHVVVADEVRGYGPPVRCPSAARLVDALRRCGLQVHVGPVVTVASVADGAQRHTLATSGALAVDTESYLLAGVAAPGCFAVLRVVVDAPEAPLWHPGIVSRGFRGLRTLRTAAAAIMEWAGALSESPGVLRNGPADVPDDKTPIVDGDATIPKEVH